MPVLQKFHEEFKEQVTIISVDIGRFTSLGSHGDAEDLLQELSVTYPAGFTNEGNILRNYTVLEMPFPRSFSQAWFASSDNGRPGPGSNPF